MEVIKSVINLLNSSGKYCTVLGDEGVVQCNQCPLSVGEGKNCQYRFNKWFNPGVLADRSQGFSRDRYEFCVDFVKDLENYQEYFEALL